jgi:hypothetical protein
VLSGIGSSPNLMIINLLRETAGAPWPRPTEDMTPLSKVLLDRIAWDDPRWTY